MRRLDDLPLWRLLVLNIAIRLAERADRALLIGDALIERMRERWRVEWPS